MNDLIPLLDFDDKMVRDMRIEARRGMLNIITKNGHEYITAASLKETIEANIIAPKPLLPKSDTIALYRHFDADGTLLYVGIAVDPMRRLYQHEKFAHWYPSISRIEIERFPSREEAIDAEIIAIRSENPKYNIVGKVLLCN